MRTIVFIFLLVFTLFKVTAQAPILDFIPNESDIEKVELKGKLKSIQQKDYFYRNGKWELSERCKICPDKISYSKKGCILEEQVYVVLEPVDELRQGYCAFVKSMCNGGQVEGKRLKKSHFNDVHESHFKDSVYRTNYSRVKSGDTVIIKDYKYLTNYWYNHQTKLNDLLIKEEDPRKDTYFHYYPNGKIQSEIMARKGSRIDTAYTSYFYNNDNQLVYKRSDMLFYDEMDWDETQIDSTVYAYHANGKLKSEKTWNKRIYNGSGVQEMSPREMITWNDKGLKIGRSYYQTFGDTVTSRITYVYHADGKIATKTIYKRGLIDEMHSYNNKGQLVKLARLRSDGSIYSWWMYDYDENGSLLTLEEYVSRNGSVELELSFIYDRHENWVLYERYYEGKLKMKKEREISYYE